MARHNLLDTDTVALNDIFTNGRRYQVPLYQRDYSWKEENWDDLWTDILSVYKQETRVHYMGAIVLQDLKEKQYSIIDGQQRLATLSIIALAVIRRIQDLIESGVEAKLNKLRVETLMRQYIGDVDALSLKYSNKLKLNENNDWFYRGFLAQHKEPINEHRLSDSNSLLIKAFRYFYSETIEVFGENPSGQELVDFLQNYIAEKLVLIRIEVQSEFDAYKVFETLNSRGINLSISDLLKNYLLALSGSVEAKDQWNRIVQIIDLEDLPLFLKHFWNSHYSYTREDKLFKVLVDTIDSSSKAFDLLDDLEKYVAVYSALNNPNDELWENNKQIRKGIRDLKLFNVTQPFPLLMVAYFLLPNHFADILRFCSVIAFRYNVIAGLNPNKQEKVFHDVAKKVFEGQLANANQVAQELKEIYLSDEEFKNVFVTKQLNTKSKKKLARYILFSLENQIAKTDRDFEDETATIEHILPETENLPTEWQQNFSIEEQEKNIYRLGNLTLLERTKNGLCGTKPFEEKQEIYHQSQYEMTKNLNYPEWTASQIKLRQETLAKTAIAVWKISQISN